MRITPPVAARRALSLDSPFCVGAFCMSDTSSPSMASGDPAASGIALGNPLDPRAAEYLKEQTRLARLQVDNMIEQNAFELSHLRWRRFNDQMRGALQIMVVAIGFAIVIGLVAAVWNASQADGVVVEAFSVPPTFAQNGIGGDIVADDLMNKITAIRDFADENSLAQSRHVRQDREGDIKVEIPETGISLAQAWRYLRQWFGSERPLTGNIRMLDGGRIALTVMLDSRTFTFTGAAGELDALEQKAAEHLFAAFEPSNYVLYLYNKGRVAEAYAQAGRNALLAPTDFERGFAYSLWANATGGATGDVALAFARARMSVAFAPQFSGGHMEMMNDAIRLGHDEEAVRQSAFMIGNLRREDEAPSFRVRGFTYALDSAHYKHAELLGDFGKQAGFCNVFCGPATEKLRLAQSAARLHDIAASRDFLSQAQAVGTSQDLRAPQARYFLAAATDDWSAAIGAAHDYAVALAADDPQAPRRVAITTATFVDPLLAIAQAHAGDFAAAWGTIKATPLDCYQCLRARAVVAALQGDRKQAGIWFARAVAAAPSIPFAYADYGEMLLRHGDFDGAIAQFDLAHRKGPRFADPLELWGEALIAKNRSDLAAKKFAEAARYAPNWGRLHLKWGEALLWSGDKPGAAKQFAIASSLFLTPAEAAQLARVRHG
jgi:tetratricopeptide (TPR) repeat protein